MDMSASSRAWILLTSTGATEKFEDVDAGESGVGSESGLSETRCGRSVVDVGGRSAWILHDGKRDEVSQIELLLHSDQLVGNGGGRQTYRFGSGLGPRPSPSPPAALTPSVA